MQSSTLKARPLATFQDFERLRAGLSKVDFPV